MESSSHTERLLDLLYGECTAEERAELRRAIDEDDDLAQQWQDLQAAHREIQDHIPSSQPVPDEVSESILAAASEHSQSAQRRSNGATTSRHGVWTTVMNSGRLQALASVAVLLVVSVTTYTIYQSTAPSADEVAPVSAESSSVAVADPAVDGTGAGDGVQGIAIPPEPEVQEIAELDEKQIGEGTTEESDDIDSPPQIQALRQAEERAESEPLADEPAEASSDEDTDGDIVAMRDTTSDSEVQARSPRPPQRRARSAPTPTTESEPSQAPALDSDQALDDLELESGLGGIGRGGGGVGHSGSSRRAQVDDDADAEVEEEADDEETDDDQARAQSLLQSASDALDDDDRESANAYLDELFEEGLVNTLNERDQQSAQELLQQSTETTDPAPADGPRPTLIR